MIVHRARRAAEFEALVEGTSQPVDPTQAELLELVGTLRDLGSPGHRPEPRSEFVTGLRERLLIAAREELVAEDPMVEQLTVRPARTSRERRISAALAGFALVGASASMAVASQGALPGDTLYPVKRALENAETGIAGQAKGSKLLAHAADRLREAEALAASGEDIDVVTRTLEDFSVQATDASDLLLAAYQADGDERHAQQVRDFAAVSLQRLDDIEQDLPRSARESILDAAHVVFTIDAAAAQLCPSCQGGISEIPADLLSTSAEIPTAAEKEQVSAGARRPAAGPTAAPELPVLPSAPASVTEVRPPVAAAPTPDAETTAPSPAPAGKGKVDQKASEAGQQVTDTAEKTTDTVEKTVEGTVEALEETVTGLVETVDGVLGGLTAKR